MSAHHPGPSAPVFSLRGHSGTLAQATRHSHDDFGGVRLEQRGHIGRRLVNRLDQRRDPRRHHEQELSLDVSRVPPRVGRPATGQHRRAGADLELFVSKTEPQPPAKHIPRLIIFVVDMQGRNPMVTNLDSPLRDDEIISRSTENASR
jgi:hypothetical protein